MPYYDFECEECGRMVTVCRTVEDRHNPVLCGHGTPVMNGIKVSVSKMKRVVERFDFNANLAKDQPENQMGRILTRSTSRKDWLEVEKREANNYEKTRKNDKTPPEYVPMDKIDLNGAWTAAHAGPDQLQRWRKDNVKDDVDA